MTYCEMMDLPADQCGHCRPTDRLSEVEAMVRAELRKHGLSDWSFKYDRAKTRLGQCNYSTKTISLSKDWAEARNLEDTRVTILHEVAHALVGPGHGHDSVWRRQAQALGIRGDRCSDTKGVKIEASVKGTCPAGHTTTMHRLPQRVQSCGKCSPRRFSSQAIFTWTKDGKPAVMGQRYKQELARVKAS